MSKLSVAVCDTNRAYGECIGSWMFVEWGTEFSGGFFSSAEMFQEQYERQQFQVILLARAFLLEAWIQAEIKSRRDILWLYLQEEGEEGEVFLDGEISVIEKYQPVPVVIRSIYRYLEEYRKEEGKVLGEATEILGWFSPEQCIWQTPLAMTMAELLAEEERVLYVNLKECSGLGQWFQEEYERDLLDMMYYSQNQKQKNFMDLGSFVYTQENFDYLPPVRDGVLLGELQEEDYVRLLETVERTSYDVVVLDMGRMFPGFFKVWKQCSSIYIPQEQNVLANGMRREFEEEVKRQKDFALEEKISWLSLPDWNKKLLTPGNLMQQWIWGGQGDYVRELLGKRSGRD